MEASGFRAGFSQRCFSVLDAFSVYLPGLGEQFQGSVLSAPSETAEVQEGPAVSGAF